MTLSIVSSLPPTYISRVYDPYSHYLACAVRQIGDGRTFQHIRHYGGDRDRSYMKELAQDIGASLEFIDVTEIIGMNDTAFISRIAEDADAILVVTDGSDPGWARIEPLIPSIPVHMEIFEIGIGSPDEFDDESGIENFLDWFTGSKLHSFFGYAAVLPGSLKNVTADVRVTLRQRSVPYIILTSDSNEMKSKQMNIEIIERASVLISLSPGIIENRRLLLDYARNAGTPIFSFAEPPMSESPYWRTVEVEDRIEWISILDEISTSPASNGLYLPISSPRKSYGKRLGFYT